MSRTPRHEDFYDALRQGIQRACARTSPREVAAAVDLSKKALGNILTGGETNAKTPFDLLTIEPNTGALDTNTDPNSHVVAFDMRGREGGSQFEGPHDTANIRAADGGSSRSYVAASACRRLTPAEFEKLQGFEPGYTLVPYRGGMMADGPRYKALGNSMAVPVVRWIGERIRMVEALGALDQEQAA